jgi:hypothetical protein
MQWDIWQNTLILLCDYHKFAEIPDTSDDILKTQRFKFIAD